MPASIPSESETVRCADNAAITSAHVTLLSSGVDVGSIADVAGLDDDVRSSSSANGAKELDVARGTTMCTKGRRGALCPPHHSGDL